MMRRRGGFWLPACLLVGGAPSVAVPGPGTRGGVRDEASCAAHTEQKTYGKET